MSSSRRITSVVLGAILMSSVVPAPSASAWMDDELQFVQDARAINLGIDNGIASLVNMGNQLCTRLLHNSESELAAAAFQDLGGQVPYAKLAAVTAAAHRDMCPGF